MSRDFDYDLSEERNLTYALLHDMLGFVVDDAKNWRMATDDDEVEELRWQRISRDDDEKSPTWQGQTWRERVTHTFALGEHSYLSAKSIYQIRLPLKLVQQFAADGDQIAPGDMVRLLLPVMIRPKEFLSDFNFTGPTGSAATLCTTTTNAEYQADYFLNYVLRQHDEESRGWLRDQNSRTTITNWDVILDLLLAMGLYGTAPWRKKLQQVNRVARFGAARGLANAKNNVSERNYDSDTLPSPTSSSFSPGFDFKTGQFTESGKFALRILLDPMTDRRPEISDDDIDAWLERLRDTGKLLKEVLSVVDYNRTGERSQLISASECMLLALPHSKRFEELSQNNPGQIREFVGCYVETYVEFIRRICESHDIHHSNLISIDSVDLPREQQGLNLLKFLSRLGRSWIPIVETTMPVDQPCTLEMSERRPLTQADFPISGHLFVYGDADSTNVTVRCIDPSITIQGLKLDPRPVHKNWQRILYRNSRWYRTAFRRLNLHYELNYRFEAKFADLTVGKTRWPYEQSCRYRAMRRSRLSKTEVKRRLAEDEDFGRMVLQAVGRRYPEAEEMEDRLWAAWVEDLLVKWPDGSFPSDDDYPPHPRALVINCYFLSTDDCDDDVFRRFSSKMAENPDDYELVLRDGMDDNLYSMVSILGEHYRDDPRVEKPQWVLKMFACIHAHYLGGIRQLFRELPTEEAKEWAKIRLADNEDYGRRLLQAVGRRYPEAEEMEDRLWAAWVEDLLVKLPDGSFPSDDDYPPHPRAFEIARTVSTDQLKGYALGRMSSMIAENPDDYKIVLRDGMDDNLYSMVGILGEHYRDDPRVEKPQWVLKMFVSIHLHYLEGIRQLLFLLHDKRLEGEGREFMDEQLKEGGSVQRRFYNVSERYRRYRHHLLLEHLQSRHVYPLELQSDWLGGLKGRRKRWLFRAFCHFRARYETRHREFLNDYQELTDDGISLFGHRQRSLSVRYLELDLRPSRLHVLSIRCLLLLIIPGAVVAMFFDPNNETAILIALLGLLTFPLALAGAVVLSREATPLGERLLMRSRAVLFGSIAILWAVALVRLGRHEGWLEGWF